MGGSTRSSADKCILGTAYIQTLGHRRRASYLQTSVATQAGTDPGLALGGADDVIDTNVWPPLYRMTIVRTPSNVQDDCPKP